MRTFGAIVLLLIAQGLAGCGASPVAPPSTQQTGAQSAPTLMVFTEKASGFATTDLRDVQEQILQFIAGEVIWKADGTRLSGYRIDSHDFGAGPVYFIAGKICAEGCALEVRFGTRDGERRAYLTADYGHDNPGTLVDVEVVAGALVATRTNVFPPGTFTLSGVVTEMTPAGPAPVEGAWVDRGMTTGSQGASTDKNGFYSILGMYNGTGAVAVGKTGYKTEQRDVSINGDTRFDIQLVRQ
jgi:hypothetical protein